MSAADSSTLRHPPVWFFYLVAASLGIAFLITLLYLAWGNAVENETRQFAYESVTLDDTVASNVRAANTALENVASLFSAIARVDEREFVAFTGTALARHAFIGAIGCYVWSEGVDGDLRLRFSNARTPAAALPDHIRLREYGAATMMVRSALRTGGVIPTTTLIEDDGASRFMLLRRVPAAGGTAPPGLLVMAVETVSLVGQAAADPNLGITLYSESEGVGGRQLLYRKAPSRPAAGRPIDTLEASTLVRFDEYSVRLIAAKGLYWADLGKPLIFVALVLGVGVTLLLVALARAKELQARELQERNIVIEDQVRRQTRELADARDQALQASRVKSDFLASMSHEIRTPLNAIIGMAELLGDTRLSADQAKYVEVFKNAGEALLSLVNDILDLSKIEARQLVLERIDFNLQDVIDQSVDIYALKTDAKGVELAAHVDPAVPVQLKGDPSRLRQVILNLVGNAIKFTDQGEIVVSVQPVSVEDGFSRLRFSVTDTGIGIPQDKLDAIFTSFTQVDSSTTRKYGGTGLGLTISKELIELMHGRIWAESVEGAGSTFKFEAGFEISKDHEYAAGQRQDSGIDGISVLLIDDNATNRMILTEILKSEGAVVVEAASGREGIAQYRARREAGKAFDLILCDVRMPETDGFSVAEAVAVDQGHAGTVLMLSSAELASELERAQRIGVRHYIVKPVKRADLLKAIRDTLTPAFEQPAPARSEAAAGARSAVLLVEDNADNRLLIKAYMKRGPYQITEAENGAEAVEKFKQGRFDVVLMDVQMPVMDGHEATRAIRAWEREQGREPTIIIALTAHAIREDRDKSFAAGCNDHLTKPIKKQALLNSLAEHLS